MDGQTNSSCSPLNGLMTLSSAPSKGLTETRPSWDNGALGRLVLDAYLLELLPGNG